ncbi:MAG: PQQ-binding-like beta-propeller repeat protein [Deltaproteobacteria bacterium]|nr:PQQ-binding-like beta-propeller repeat protein [Deltaproteobacteria bacterium]MDQ3295564.1 PQQ-like beta-propeller repeat protein [Myxococcota bacterium]
MRRWLVTLALAVVALPTGGGEAVADRGFRVELSSRSVTTTTSLPVQACEPRIARLPASVELDPGGIVVTTRTRRFRHGVGRPGGMSWIVTAGDHVIVGYAERPGGHADTIVAIDHRTGALAWRRTVDSLFAAELVDDLLAVERAGTLDILDARTGKTQGTTPLAGQGIQAVCRPRRGDLHVKTRGDLVAIDRASGAVRWVQASTSVGNPTVTPTAVIDAWVDRTAHRFGIVSYDPATGRRLATVDLGATGGWYDLERVIIAPDGTHDVLVSAMFAVE